MSADPFGTAALRAAVLDAWSRSPTRLREDANTEEDHATGYYRDRVVVELAQNAADAATRAGAPGRLLLRLVEDADGATLVAASTGEALDARGVESLSSMRASSKTGDARSTVGRFGVGFAAVRGVSDDVVVRTAAGGVRFSVALTREAIAGLASAGTRSGLESDEARSGQASEGAPSGVDLAAVVDARGDSLPALRLPFAVAPGVESPWATVVEARLRDAAAVAEVRRQLDEVDDTLLLALPALESVEVQHRASGPVAGACQAAGTQAPDAQEGQGDRVLSDVGSRWVTAHASGTVPSSLVADRPVEERDRSTWTITWAVRRAPSAGAGAGARAGAGAGVAQAARADGVVCAPTPTEERLTVPALLIASFPLDPSRRHVADVPLADFVADQAGPVLARLAAALDDPLALVPTGLPAGRLDARIRDSVTAALREEPIFDGRRARDVAVLGGGTSGGGGFGDDAGRTLFEALAPTGLGVVDVPTGRVAAARTLGMPVLSVPDVVDALPSALTPAQWRALYAALATWADTDRAVREALDGVLVPLADGTTARGPRGLVLPPAGAVVDGLLTVPGLRVVHPEAADPLLRRLGAVDVHDPTVLGLAAVESAVQDVAELLTDRDVDGPREATGLGALPGLLLLLDGVVRSGGRAPEDLPSWWGELPLPGADGLWTRASDLARPGTWAAEHLDLELLDPDALTEVLERSGGGPAAGADVVTAVSAALDALVAVPCGVRSGLAVQTVDLDTGDADDDLGSGPDGSGSNGSGLRGSGRGDRPDVPGWADYDAYLCAVLGRGVHLDELPVLHDLDAVHDDSWGEVVRLAERDPDVRRALVATVGPGPRALSYAAWYLRDVLEAPFVVRGETDPLDAELLAVLPPAPDDLDGVHDAQVLAALGGVATVEDLSRLLASPDPVVWDGFFAALERAGSADGAAGLDSAARSGGLARPDSSARPDDAAPSVGVAVPPRVARAVWDALGQAAVAGLELGGLELDDLPEVLLAVRGGACRTVDASTAVVAVDPMWTQVRAVVPAAGQHAGEAVADVLDLPLADRADVVVQTPDDPTTHEVPAAVLALLRGVPAVWSEHDDLVVDGQDVDWWVTADGGVHLRAGSSRTTLAQALAQAGGRWGDRYLLETLLADPARARDVDLDGAWG